MVLVQESHIGQNLERLMTKWHPAYQTICPLTSWETRPRVMTYARKDRKHLQCNPAPLDPHPDLASIDISTPCGFKMRVYNVYNAGPSSARAGEAVEALTNCVDITGTQSSLGTLTSTTNNGNCYPTQPGEPPRQGGGQTGAKNMDLPSRTSTERLHTISEEFSTLPGQHPHSTEPKM